MSGDYCTCGWRFLDVEDYRDHLPCPGTPAQQREAELEARIEELQERLRFAAEQKVLEIAELAEESEGVRVLFEQLVAVLDASRIRVLALEASLRRLEGGL